MSCRSVAARLCLLACALAIPLFAPAVASAGGNLVTNGRFQEPTLASSFGIFGEIPGWSETNGCGIEVWSHDFIIPSPFQAQVIELNSQCPSRIQQTIATTPGERYTVTYYYGARPGTGAAENIIEPAWNGDAQTSHSTDDTTLRQYTFTVTGTGSDVLSFRSLTHVTGVGTLMSLVSVTAADEGPQVEFAPANVSGRVGSPLSTTGKFTTPSSGALDISASVGSVSAQPDGSFTWTHTPTAPVTAAPVTITATDADGRTATTSFTMTATPAPAVSVAGCITRNANGVLGNYTAQITNLPAQTVYVFTERAPTTTTDLTNMYLYGFDFVNGSGTVLVSSQFNAAPADLSRVYVTVRPQDWPSGVLAQTVVPICGADDTAPVETPTVDGTLGSDGWYAGDVGISWLVTDAESPVTSTTGCDAQTLSTDTAGATYTCSATSDGGTSSNSVTVKRDATAPVLSVPTAPVVVEAVDGDGAPATYEATASDATSGPAGVLCTQPSGSTFPVGDTTVSCQAGDVAGNQTTGTFTVRVVDTTAPSFVAPRDVTAEATGPDGATADYDAPATTDAVDGDGTAICDRASGSTFALGATQVTCTATDKAGNTRSKSFAVNVVDTTAPSVDVADQTVEATGPDGASVDLGATAHDVVDGAVPASCDPASGSTFALGTTTVTCSATDAHGNTGDATATVKVLDTTAPAFDAPADTTAEATGPDGARVSYAAPATADAVDGPGTASCDPASGATFALGTTQVTCTATDNAGNARSKSFTVKVRDTTAPQLSLPSDVAATATSAQGAKVAYAAATSADTVDGSVPVACTPASGTQFAPGTTTVTCTATDNAGNTATGTFEVAVTFAWGSGFAEPLRNNALTGNAGRTVPLKFTLTGASARVTVAKAVVLLGRQGKTLSQVAVDTVSGGDFHYNLSTKGLTPGVYTVRVDLGDGVKRDATLTLS